MIAEKRIRVIQIQWSSSQFASDSKAFTTIKSHVPEDLSAYADPSWVYREQWEAQRRIWWCLQQVPESALILTTELMTKAEYDARGPDDVPVPLTPRQEKKKQRRVERRLDRELRAANR